MTSNWQTIWATLCDHATNSGTIEVEDAIPELTEKLSVTKQEARREINFLLEELSRLPEGRQYFRLEGNAVVPLPEFQNLPADTAARRDAYPFEL